MRRQETRVTKQGSARLTRVVQVQAEAADDPVAVANAIVDAWPLYQRLIFGRRFKRAMKKSMDETPPWL